MARRHRIFEMPIIQKANGELVVDPQAVAALDEDLQENSRIKAADIKDKIQHSKMRKVRVNDVSLSTDERAVPHGFGFVPEEYNVICRGEGYWYESRRPDTQFVYVKANADVTADVIIKG